MRVKDTRQRLHVRPLVAALAVWGVAAVAVALLSARGQSTAQQPAQQPTFGQVAAPAPAPVVPGTYQKDAVRTCLRQCHNIEPIIFILETPHAVKADSRTPFADHQCETCHGPSPEHIETASTPVQVVFKGPKKSPAAVINAKCMTCHELGLRVHWTGSQHEARGLACTDCHNIHAKEQKVLSKATQAEVCFTCHKEQRSETRRISAHPLATTSLASAPKMACSDCHNPHGSTGPTLLIKNSVNETCYMCHPDKRGPFLWEHSPVVDSCVNCHTPHGSTNASLLKTRAPWLCQECHSGDHANQVNSGANLAGGNVTTVNGMQTLGPATPRIQVSARACLNCHVLIHGSNSPAGAKFQR
jgi:DmsE family decaheme c-type cytochrome